MNPQMAFALTAAFVLIMPIAFVATLAGATILRALLILALGRDENERREALLAWLGSPKRR